MGLPFKNLTLFIVLTLIISTLLYPVHASAQTIINFKSKEEFLTHMNEIQRFVDQQNWTIAEEKTKNLRTLYHQKHWILQLFGDESEYEGLQQSINRLIAAIKEKDMVQSKVAIADIRTLIQNIYEL